MKESPHITLTAEQDKRDTIHCAMWAGVVLFGMLALTTHGMAFLSWTEPTMEEIYARKNMQRDIEVMEGRVKSMEFYATEILELRKHTHPSPSIQNHTHHFLNGKVKKEVIK